MADDELQEPFSPLALFHEDQTRPYTPSERTKAYWEYAAIFLSHARADDYICKHFVEGNGDEPAWTTRRPGTQLFFRHLNEKLLPSHINHRHVLGAKAADGLTRFVVIDLDYHGGDRELFLKQAEVLLKHFYGHGTWHLQVCPDDLQGVHFIRVFDQPVLLDYAIEDLRERLDALDRDHPDLAAEARRKGIKSFSQLELYPSTQHGVRLPLCRDRWLLLDDYVKPIRQGKRDVGDVERYVRWLKDPTRKHKDRDEVLDFLRAFTPDESVLREGRQRKQAAQQSACDRSPTLSTEVTWRKCYRKLRNDFFLDGNANGIDLNEHLVVTARVSVAYGKTPEQIRAGLIQLLRTLPDAAKASSGRLSRQDWPALERQIDWVSNATPDYGHQRDPIGSQDKLKQVAARLYHLGEDPLDKTTWKANTASATLALSWSRNQRYSQYAHLAPVLCTKDHSVVSRFIDYVVSLVHRRQGRSLSVPYLRKCFTEHFPGVSFTSNTKMSRILALLMSLGVITRTSRGYSGIGSTYTLAHESHKALAATTQPHTHNTSMKISSATLRRSWRELRPHHSKEESLSLRGTFSYAPYISLSLYKPPYLTSICSHPISNPHMPASTCRGPPFLILVGSAK